ncbi:MAG: hypothetical protein GTO67_13360 [Gammaproteobacteria bacterium]|nr:hypothetical protein [Gammaproteobacteria bacterium]NIN39556.1 hypothetical protein [Gammaproteobacteria bacterium]NIO25113.1 hypothetical protein [Gammaproteobacteria bacterium]NIO65742.1 hypothetical protein [Gammaproteobacteria bacterium]NIP45821.1 hypothetical protein [Gammaproteobacteria bacterium]
MRALVLALVLASTPCLATAGQSFLVVVSGIGGEAEFTARFAERSTRMLEAAESHMQLPRERIVHLGENPGDGVDGQSTKAEIENTITRLAGAAEPGDTLFVLLIGHGTARGDRILFNLPGPDMSATELHALLEARDGLRWVIVNTSPSSGPFVRALSGPDRVVVTATSNAAERYSTVFADHFIAAYAGKGADTDKNGRISVLEAFEFARREVKRQYEAEGRLQSEHAVLDDSDGLARTTYLESDRTLYSRTLPADELDRLLAERDALEQRIESLVTEKPSLSPAVYDDRLEALLVEFALVHRALRAPGERQ